jgi:hypothetical protein
VEQRVEDQGKSDINVNRAATMNAKTTKQNDRKQRERYLLDRFLVVSEIDAIITGEGESPDFEIALDGRRIGVEITELFAENPQGLPPLQAHESLSAEITVAAKALYEKDGEPHVHVSIGFFTTVQVPRAQKNKLASAIATLVRRLVQKDGDHVVWDNNYEDDQLEGVAYLNVLRVANQEHSHWSVSRGGFFAPLELSTITSRISEKLQRLAAYRRKFPEIWLVVAIDGSRPSQFFDLRNIPDMTAIESDFDRTYFFSSFPPKAIRIGASTT